MKQHENVEVSACNSLPADFDAELYLKLNPDVERLISSGRYPNAESHYLSAGHLEDRYLKEGIRATPPRIEAAFSSFKGISRRSRTLANLDLNKAGGLEIGALCYPMVTKQEGSISYVDFATRAQSVKKYKSDSSVDVSKIVEVDYVWGKQNLQSCVNRRKFDFVVASHVVEHVPDLIGWLQEITAVLKPNGKLRLVAPDRRFTFDYLRNETQLHDVLDAYLNQQRRPSTRQILEFCDLAREVDHVAAWKGGLDAQALVRKSDEADGMKLARQSLRSDRYFDVHCWVFTPISFARLMVRLAERKMLKLRCDLFIPTQQGEIEFYAHMSKDTDHSKVLSSWQAAVSAIETAGSVTPNSNVQPE